MYLTSAFFGGARSYSPSRTQALVGAFVCGLGLTNQHSLIFFVLPLGACVLAQLLSVQRRHESDERIANDNGFFSFMSVLASVGCFFALGLSLYAIYMPMATGAQGSWGDCTTIAGFLKHLLRQEYGTFVLHPDMTSELSMVDRIRLYVGSIATELPGATQKMFLLIIIFGSVVSIFARGHAGRVIALMWLTYVLVFHALSNLDL